MTLTGLRERLDLAAKDTVKIPLLAVATDGHTSSEERQMKDERENDREACNK